MVGVLSGVLGENQDVIQIHKDKAVQEVLEFIIDQSLEDSWSISEVE